jgi:formylmethanofuran dehydrogenase subunit B
MEESDMMKNCTFGALLRGLGLSHPFGNTGMPKLP